MPRMGARPLLTRTYVPGPPYRAYGLRVPASCVPYVPEAQGNLPREEALLYVRGTRARLGRAVCVPHAYTHTTGGLPQG